MKEAVKAGDESKFKKLQENLLLKEHFPAEKFYEVKLAQSVLDGGSKADQESI